MSVPPGRPKPPQTQRFSYRPLLGQAGHPSHRFGEAALVHSAPSLLHTDAESAAAALSDWVGSTTRCGVIDLRSEADFARVHLAGSTSLPWGNDISGADFIARAHELPERGARLALLADEVRVAVAASDHMRRAGYVIHFTIALPADGLASAVWPVAPAASLASSIPLWHPSPCLSELIETIERQLGDRGESSKTILDLGCGTGRDCIFLAMRGGFTVTGVDYLEKQLVRARDLASRCDVAQSCTFRQMDVCVGAPAEWLPAAPADIVHIGRFLHRPLLPVLRDHCVAPGGFIIYHTFMVGCEAFGRPRKPEHLLRKGELRELFVGWDVLMDEVRPCSDGRPLSWFAARKPQDSRAPSTVPTALASAHADATDCGGMHGPAGNEPGMKRKKPERLSRQQRQVEATTLPRRFESFYKGVRPRGVEDWDAFERRLLAPHRGFCFRVCGGAAAATATGQELLATFGDLILPAEAAASAAGLRRLEWTADGGRSWRFVASRSELRSEPQLGALRDWVVKRQRTGQVRKEDLADMLPVVALLRQCGSAVERVIDLCAAPPHLAPGVGTGRLLDCLWDGGDYSADGAKAAASKYTPQAKRLLVSNEQELSRCWMVLQDAGLPESRRSLSPLVLCASKAEAFPIPPAGYNGVLLQVPCSADAQFRKNGAGSSACRDWEPRTAMRLHKRQLGSLIRSLHLLQVDGVVVYSARSFNPLECEAVIGAVLELCGSSVVLESVDSTDGSFLLVNDRGDRDCDDSPSTSRGLKVRGGMTDWRVPNLAHPSWRQDLNATVPVAGEWPSSGSASTGASFGPWYLSHKEAVEAGSTALKSFFPPEDVNIAGSLLKCARLLPQDNDSDGCFVAVLKRVGSLTVDVSDLYPKSQNVDSLASKAVDTQPTTTSKRGAFSVPVTLRNTLAGGVGGIVACAELPSWRSVRSFFGIDASLAAPVDGCIFLTNQDTAGKNGGLGSVYAATEEDLTTRTACCVAQAAATLASLKILVVRVGALVIVPSSARAAVTQGSEDCQAGCTHRLVDGSASWILSKSAPRIVQTSNVAEFVQLALGEICSVEALGSTTQKALSVMTGGCVIYTVAGSHEFEAESCSVPGSSLGLGLECVVGWKTAGSKLMVFVAKPYRQLAKERRSAFGLQRLAVDCTER